MQAPDVDMMRVENPIGPGTPDVNFSINGVDGWIELKELDHWPVRPSTVVKIDHYKPNQRLWIRRRGMAGGRVFLLLRVNATSTYMLFGWEYAWEHVGRVTREELMRNALIKWSGEFDECWLIHAITQ